MLIADKIIFGHYYCINSAQTKEMMLHYILQPSNIFTGVKAFNLMLVVGGVRFLIINTCFAWPPVTSINKSSVLIACGHENRHINTCLFSSEIYAC